MRNLPKSGLFGKIQKSQPMIRKCQNPTWIVGGTRPKSGLFKELYIQKNGPIWSRNVNPIQIGRSSDPPYISFWKSGFKKSKHHPFKMVPNLAFLGKKRRNYWPRARAEKNPDTAKKTCQIRVDTVSFLLCILLVPNALPKRERSLWLPPQNVLRQGWLGHYYKSFPDYWNQVFLR